MSQKEMIAGHGSLTLGDKSSISQVNNAKYGWGLVFHAVDSLGVIRFSIPDPFVQF